MWKPRNRADRLLVLAQELIYHVPRTQYGKRETGNLEFAVPIPIPGFVFRVLYSVFQVW